jgi:hypothetical protein
MPGKVVIQITALSLLVGFSAVLSIYIIAMIPFPS